MGKEREQEAQERERRGGDLSAERGKMGESICIIVKPNRSKMCLDNERTRWWLGRTGLGIERWKVEEDLTTTEG